LAYWDLLFIGNMPFMQTLNVYKKVVENVLLEGEKARQGEGQKRTIRHKRTSGRGGISEDDSQEEVG